ncbi:AbrB/MazE/SpoVT family DNA-binding domain-containing protein [Ostreibacterium oceani]|uniref:Antitoxin MazE n=1 Tax=Ostreibacterium oceani TaxID=2654998 RepID=A0A6N7EU25_9GAMM|nr:hypothetical protein [Ostreibacterium oceani]MPV86051.1 hypothetical protein [Ostreibacterium oceani]
MQITGKITKWGNGLGLRINQEIAKGLGINYGCEVTLSLDEENHVLTVSAVNRKNKWPFKEADLIKGITVDNSHADLLTNPAGKEIDE